MTAPSVRPLPEDDAAVRRWQAPEVHSGRSPKPASEAGEKLLTADRLAAIEEQARSEGHRLGLEEGRRAGLDASRAEMQKKTAQLDALMESITPQLRVFDDVLLAQVSELVLAVARQFVRRELRSQPGEVVRVVRDALSALPASEARVRVYLNPEDAAVVRDALSPDSTERPLQILEDITLSQGGARLETESSVVDASLETRLNTIAARMLGDERRSTGEAGDLPAHE